MDTLREIYGYKTFTGRGARDLREWTFGQAEDARSNEDLAHRFIVRCRETSTILPAVSTIERLCADALVAAERRIETRIAENLTADVRDHLDKLLSEMLAGNISRFIWLRNFEVGNNSAAANRLLDRLEFLRTLNINHSALASIPAHRIARLRRQGERYFTDGLRDITSDRRWAILAVCVVEWEAAIADAIVETHDRIVGKTWREAKRQHDETISGSKATLTDTIRTFTALGASLLEARSDGTPLEMAVASSVAWDRLAQLVATGTQLSNTLADEPLAYVGQGYHRFRRYAPRMLRCLSSKPRRSPDHGSSSFVDRRDERCCIARKAFPAAQLQMEPSFTSSGKRRYPSLGSGGTLSPPGCFSFRRCLASLIRAAMVTSSRYWCR